MIITFVGDPHCRIRSPRGRIDQAWDVIYNKFQWIRTTMKEYNSSILVSTGDFMDSADPSYLLVTNVINMLKEFKASNIDVYTILGQHDIFGYQLDSINSCGIGPIFASGLITKLNTMDLENVFIQASDYGMNPSLLNPKTNAKLKVLVIHDLIQEAPLYPGDDFVDAHKFIKNSKFNLVIVGDYHYSYDILDKRGNRIIAPGALYRKTLAKRDMENEPKIVLLNTETLEVQVLKIPIKPYSSVFNLGLIEQDQKLSQLLKDKAIFASSLKGTNVTAVTWENAMKDIEESNTLEPHIIEMVKNDISEAIKAQVNTRLDLGGVE